MPLQGYYMPKTLIHNIILLCIANTAIILPHDFPICSLQDLMEKRPDIEYIKCHNMLSFAYKEFPISRFPELQPHKGLMAETFIAKIPQGQVCSVHGWIKVDNNIVSDFILHHYSAQQQQYMLSKTPFNNIKKIKGRVAVISMFLDITYGHWIYNVLSRLALLESQGIEYDWLYVGYDYKFMRETLTLWGIDPAKIITPFGDTSYIEADELIIPSQIGVRHPQSHEYKLNWIPLDLYCKKWNVDPATISLQGNTPTKNDTLPPVDVSIDDYFLPWAPLCGCYLSEWFSIYLQNKFLPKINTAAFSFSDKVFISRSGYRKMINEDEIFALFQAQGFCKYSLENLSIVEQIALFNNAKTIVATNGSSLSNLIFSQPNTTVIEIFLARSDSTFYYFSDVLKLNHFCIKTREFTNIEENFNTYVDPTIIQDFIEKNSFLF